MTVTTPYVTSVSPMPLQPTLNTKVQRDRRHRYSDAEQALARTAKRAFSEVSPQELQIRALTQATTNLSDYAEAARGNATRLRAMLADREVDPATYESIKRERWMEEKRHSAADLECKTLHAHLEATARGNGRGVGSQGELASDAKQRRNLQRFIETSSSRMRLRSNHTFLLSPPHQATLSVITPLQIRSLTNTELLELTKARTRAMALAKPLPEYVPFVEPPPARLQIRDSVAMTFGIGNPLSAITESTASNVDTQDSIFASPLPTPNSLTTFPLSSMETPFTSPDTPYPESRPGDLRTRRVSIANALKELECLETGEGTAIIYHPNSSRPRSKAEILADLSPVSMPEYAIHLLDDFEDDYGVQLPLSLGRISRMTSPPLSPDISDWEVLTPGWPHRPSDVDFPSTTPPTSPVSIQFLTPPSPSRTPSRGHRTMFSLDSSLQGRTTSLPSFLQHRPSVLRKRPSHRPASSLAAIHETRPNGPMHAADPQTRTVTPVNAQRSRRNLSMGSFHARRPVDVEVTVTKATRPASAHFRARSPPSIVSQVEAGSTSRSNAREEASHAPKGGLRRKGSLARLFGRRENEVIEESVDEGTEAEDPSTPVAAPPDVGEQEDSLRVRMKKRLTLPSWN